MSKPSLLVMAAGVGSRYGGLKQIDPVGPNGEIVIDYSIYDAKRAGFGKVVFVIRQDIDADFREAIGNRIAKQIPVEYAYQELTKVPAWFQTPATRKKPWGTTQAVLMAEDAIHEPFAVINADDYYGVAAYRVMSGYLQTAQDKGGVADYSMVGFTLRQTLSEHGTVARGVCQVDANRQLVTVDEMTAIEKVGNGARYKQPDGTVLNLTGDEPVSMNFWGFTPSVFGHCRHFFESFLRERGQEEKSETFIPKTVDELIRAKRATVRVLSSPDAWFGVTYKEDKPHVVQSLRALIAKGVYPEKLWG
jgi:hypothetical protein